MKLIVGLGNPGRAYKRSRHNVGSLLIDKLAKIRGIELKRSLLLRAHLAKTRFKNKQVILARPICYMNLSGPAVRRLVEKYRVKPEDLLIVLDDLDLEWGKGRIKPKGSAGGHNGLESIIKSLGNSDFTRLRIGISRPKRKSKVVDYVLGEWSPQEQENLDIYLERAADCCQNWIMHGIEKAMNEYNKSVETNTI